jgi:acetyl esterase/lipase
MARLRGGVVVFAFVLLGRGAAAQDSSASWAVRIGSDYQMVPNIVYLTANNTDLKLDVYHRRDKAIRPTVVAIHGGGWTGGTKESYAISLLPWLEAGFNLVNVEYRLARVSLAPAAVEDCRCALRWVYEHAKDYGFDTERLVTTGGSAGAHLALTTGMLPASAGLDRQCPSNSEYKVAAIVNWYGITDVVDLLDGPNRKSYAVTWLGSLLDREQVARRVSPLTYIRASIPPVITIHGDADPTVPYEHATRLREALSKSGVANELVTIPGGKHGGFPVPEMQRAWAAIREFVRHQGAWPAASTPSSF